MSETKPEKLIDGLPVSQWLEIRKEAGRTIDPATAEVIWSDEQTLDPYGIDEALPEECQQVGREYFARARGSDIWVSFGDLPTGIREALWAKHSNQLAFPAGLPSFAELETFSRIINGLSPFEN
ncbi:hypothetical protein BH10PSE9_BH10PSE9_14120 [soil metagenome]